MKYFLQLLLFLFKKFFQKLFCSKKWKNKIQKISHNIIEKNLGTIKPIFSILKLMEKG